MTQSIHIDGWRAGDRDCEGGCEGVRVSWPTSQFARAGSADQFRLSSKYKVVGLFIPVL